MSTAYQPQTDGQTEWINQVAEAYLQSYYNYEQHKWSSMLAIARYAYDNLKHSVTKISLFYTKNGFQLRTNWLTDIQFRNLASELYGQYMQSVPEKRDHQLELSIDSMNKYCDTKWNSIEPFTVGEFVNLN